MLTTFLQLLVNGNFFRRSMAANSKVLGWNWPKFILVRDITVVLVSCNYEDDLMKNEGARLLTSAHHYNPMEDIRWHGNQSSNPFWSLT